MKRTGHPLTLAFACLTVALLVASGCGGDASPTAPSMPAPGGGTGFSGEGNVVVSGTVTSGGGFQSESLAPSAGADGISVTVPGTNIAAVTNGSGGFVLNGVPSGNVQLHFRGPDVDAGLALQGLNDGTLVMITVEVQGASAALLSREDADKLRVRGEIIDLDELAGSFVLEDGTIVQIDDETEWRGKTDSFLELAAEFADGKLIEVEVEGMVPTAGTADILASKVDAVDVAETRLEGVVTAVDPATNSFTVDDVAFVQVGPATEWRGGLADYDDLLAQFLDGETIEVEVEGHALRPDQPFDVLASKVDGRAIGEDDDDGDDDDDDGDDPATLRVRGLVTAVDEVGGTFLIDGGTLVQVDGNTRWRGKAGSFNDLVADFLAGLIIEVEAEGPDDGGDLLASKVDVLDLQELRARGLVTDLDPVTETLVVDGTTLVQVTGTTAWRGKSSSFGELADAFAVGMIIEIDAEGFELRDDVEGDLLATKVDVLNFAEARLRGDVTAVDRVEGTFTVGGTTLVIVDSQTRWQGQLGSFAALADELDAGKTIEVEVEGAELVDGGVFADKVDVLRVE